MSRPLPTPAVAVGEVVAGEAAQARQQLEELIAQANKSNFDIAETCHLIKSRGFYYPFTTAQEYFESLPIKKRKIQYLTRMAAVFDQLQIPRTVYESLGVARCREITSLDPDAEWTDPESNEKKVVSEYIRLFVEQGHALDMKDLQKYVRVLKGRIGDNDLVWRNYCFTRSTAENVVDPAIEKAKAKIGSVFKDDEGISKDAGDGRAMELVLANFLAEPDEVEYGPSTTEVSKGFDEAVEL